MNYAKNSDVLAILKDKSHQDITTQLMDVIGASSNPEAHDAAYQIYVNPNKATRIDVFERYFTIFFKNRIDQGAYWSNLVGNNQI